VDPSIYNERKKKRLQLFIVAGALASGIVIIYMSFEGLVFNSKIEEGFQQLDWSLDLFNGFHVTPDRNYSLS
jgi:hypothetical protein